MSNADSLKEDFVDLQENQGCETKFRASSLSHFWCDQLVAYPGLARAALQMTILFPTTYLCKKAFSTMLLIKTAVRNRLHGGLLHSMSMALAKTYTMNILLPPCQGRTFAEISFSFSLNAQLASTRTLQSYNRNFLFMKRSCCPLALLKQKNLFFLKHI